MIQFLCWLDFCDGYGFILPTSFRLSHCIPIQLTRIHTPYELMTIPEYALVQYHAIVLHQHAVLVQFIAEGGLTMLNTHTFNTKILTKKERKNINNAKCL